MLLRAPVIERLASPGLVHGFTTRHGGVSEGSFGTLNVSAKRGDRPEHVQENLRRIAAAGGFAPANLRRVKQIHTAEVLRASELRGGEEADALWTCIDDGPIVVSVTTADCVPILLVDKSARYAAAIHSGWRGTVANISGACVRVLAEAGCEPSSLSAAIGPCIHQSAFEVGDEVAEAFPDRFVAREGYAKPHVDLTRMVREQLVAAGLKPEQVQSVGACTHDNPETFFSYRRDGVTTGQALSFIGFVESVASPSI